MIYGYVNEICNSQLSKSSLEESKKTILAKYKLANIWEERLSSFSSERSTFQKLVNNLTKGDILVLSELNCFARTIKEVRDFIEVLSKRGVIVDILSVGVIDMLSPQGQLVSNIFNAIAELDAQRIYLETQKSATSLPCSEENTDKTIHYKDVLNFEIFFMLYNAKKINLREIVNDLKISPALFYRLSTEYIKEHKLVDPESTAKIYCKENEAMLYMFIK